MVVRVFIDESGNLGQGGDFFTIAAVVFRDGQGCKRLSRLMKKLCLQLSDTDTPLKEVKCNRLDLPQKQMILNRIALRADHEIFYITAQKKYVSLLQQAKDKNLTYNYLAGMLVLEIVRKYNDDITIHFDQHSTKVASMNSLPD